MQRPEERCITHYDANDRIAVVNCLDKPAFSPGRRDFLSPTIAVGPLLTMFTQQEVTQSVCWQQYALAAARSRFVLGLLIVIISFLLCLFRFHQFIPNSGDLILKLLQSRQPVAIWRMYTYSLCSLAFLHIICSLILFYHL